jgi:Methylamine utilisation protein MauE
MNEIALSIRILTALVFLSAALGKVRHRLAFQGVVANYRLLPQFAVPAFAGLLPAVEAAIAVALLIAPPTWPEACAAILLIVFAAAMAINIRRGRRHIDCGCFQGALKQTLNWMLVTRNVGLALLLAVPAGVSEGMTLPAAAEAVLVGFVLFVLLQSMNILWSVVPAWRLRRPITSGVEK